MQSPKKVNRSWKTQTFVSTQMGKWKRIISLIERIAKTYIKVD